MSSASLLQCPFVFWPESKCYQEHYGRLYTDPFDENILKSITERLLQNECAVQQISFHLNFCYRCMYILCVYLHRYLYVLVPQVCYIHLGFYDLLSLDQENWPAPHARVPDNSGELFSPNSFSAACARLTLWAAGLLNPSSDNTLGW